MWQEQDKDLNFCMGKKIYRVSFLYQRFILCNIVLNIHPYVIIIYHSVCSFVCLFVMSDCWDNVCSVGEYIKLHYCSASSVDQTFVGMDGTIRPASDTRLCFTIMGYGPATDTDGRPIDTPIQLQQCIPGSIEQQFVRRPGPGIGGYEFSPVGNLNRCLANLHHPKVGERIFPRLCSKAQTDTTGAWVTI